MQAKLNCDSESDLHNAIRPGARKLRGGLYVAAYTCMCVTRARIISAAKAQELP